MLYIYYTLIPLSSTYSVTSVFNYTPFQLIIPICCRVPQYVLNLLFQISHRCTISYVLTHFLLLTKVHILSTILFLNFLFPNWFMHLKHATLIIFTLCHFYALARHSSLCDIVSWDDLRWLTPRLCCVHLLYWSRFHVRVIYTYFPYISTLRQENSQLLVSTLHANISNHFRDENVRWWTELIRYILWHALHILARRGFKLYRVRWCWTRHQYLGYFKMYGLLKKNEARTKRVLGLARLAVVASII